MVYLDALKCNAYPRPGMDATRTSCYHAAHAASFQAVGYLSIHPVFRA